MKEIKYDFGWGNPYFLLDILSEQYFQKLHHYDIKNMSYAPDEGMPELIKLTQQAIQESTGLFYNYIIITAGATQAINSIFHHEYKGGFRDVVMKPYGYPFYDDMVANAGLTRRSSAFHLRDQAFVLDDSPSNPIGDQNPVWLNHDRTYWDAVYFNDIYGANLNMVPVHRAMVGSYSKLLGLTGARIGWIATNNRMYYKMISDVSLKDTATISVPSQNMMIDVLKSIDLPKFIEAGKHSLDGNKTEMQKLEKFFDGQQVQRVGMFYCAKSNPKALRLLDKCGINYVKLNDETIRLSLGQNNMLTYRAVQTVLKEDRC